MGEQEYPQLIGAAGHNPKTLEAISEIARLEGRNPEWVKKNILGRKEGSALNAPGVMAAVDFLRKETAAFKEYVTGFLAKRDAGEVTDQDYVDFQQRLMEHAHIHSQVMGIASEAGRALGVLAHTRKYYGEILDAESLDTMMNSMGGKGHIEDVADMMEAFLEGDIGKLNRYTSEVAEVRTIDKVFEAWVNALLSGPQTHVVNMTSNFLVSMNDDVVRLLASGIGKLHGGSKVYVREAVARMTSAPGAALSGMKMFSEALKDENFDDTLTKIEARHRKAIKGTAGKVIRMPGRFLSAEDLLFKKFTYVKEAHALAMHDHIENGTDYEATVDALLNVENDRLTPEQRAMRKKATEAADKATFTNPLGTFGRTLQKLANDHPSLRFIIPFIRTPTNIVKYAAQHSPVALFFKEFRQQFARGGAERDIAVARMTLGTSVGAAIAMLAAEGLVTGGGPDDPRERNILYSMGWQPYSFKIGNKYYSYGRLEPLGMIFGIAADIREMSAVASEEELESLVALFAGSFFKNVTSKTWLRGISDAINAITNPDRYGERWIQSMLGTVVPTGVAQVARTQDPVLRRRDDIRSTILSRTPLKSQDVLPRLGLWGEPVRLEGGVGPDLLSPVYISTQTLDPASAALRRISRETDWKPSTPSKKIHGVELTPEQHNQYIQLARRPAKAKLEMLASSPGFELLPVEVQKDLFKEIIDQSNKDAREMMVTMNPDLFIKGLEAQMKKAAGGF